MNKREQRHTTLYRAYRPSGFSEVRGQPHVTDVLEKAIARKHVAHAYLFAGGRGTGKTSVARILARELGVADRDLYEIDAASNRGIDDIRELRENVHALPFESPYKVYIIDEAHMLTKEAWNAFLKTLEEPPAHCIFVMATTERDRVPETILSRCEVYAFKQPTRDMIADTVTDIAKKEGFELKRPAANLIALLAEGSFRDALSVLQKILAVSDTVISLADIEVVTGAPKSDTVMQTIEALAKGETERALAALSSALESGVEARVFAKLLIHRVRLILLMRYAPALADQYAHDMPTDERTRADAAAKETRINSALLRALLDAYATMAYAALPQLPLELAIIDQTAAST